MMSCCKKTGSMPNFGIRENVMFKNYGTQEEEKKQYAYMKYNVFLLFLRFEKNVLTICSH